MSYDESYNSPLTTASYPNLGGLSHHSSVPAAAGPLSSLSQSTPDVYAHDPWSTSTHLPKPPSASLIEPFILPTKLDGLINEANLPTIYHQAFNAADPSAGTVSLANAHRVLAGTGVGASTIERILSVTSGRSSRLTKSEFTIALAAVAFTQQGKAPRAVQHMLSRNSPFPIPTLDLGGPLPTFSPGRYSYSRRSSSPEDPWSTPNSTLKSRPNPSTITNGLPFVVEEQDPSLSLALDHSLIPDSALHPSTQFLPPFDRTQRDTVTVRLSAPEGWIFKYNVYSVEHEKKGTSVPRRFSDFVWLHDCLLKRYPFRLIPGLPPKSIAISGHHLATGDETAFIERRRRALQRFLIFLVNHPVLSVDNILTTFLCEPSDLATWRSHSTVHLLEESAIIRLTPVEEMSIPEDLDSRLASFRNRLPLIVEHWSRICAGLERVTRRSEAQAADFTRIQLALGSAIESERTGTGTAGQACWRPEEARRAEEEVEVVAQHCGKYSELLDRRTRSLALSTNELVRTHRELYTDFGSLLIRLDKLGVDDVDRRLRPRAEANSKKLEDIRSARRAGWEEDSDRLRNAIEVDRAGIESKLRRRVFIRWCLWQELVHLMRMGSLVGRALRDYVDDERRFGERTLANWGEVADTLDRIVR
ncbi:hypothetical protein CROQUDRAFT_672131 [Cronartium quercuum f. sp. fusiforme G11]|uniref:Sorting nexin MVP1 n=1 Tax=Cronartium quercuum f. sp. fusiforme G11 TaxID=708437 RepID=A0A9P6NIT4_9BASI|nr:hypothetical protein CROQUDRAFT_672131 [Cronartium quercuum f. sp. fusiforme G11]